MIVASILKSGPVSEAAVNLLLDASACTVASSEEGTEVSGVSVSPQASVNSRIKIIITPDCFIYDLPTSTPNRPLLPAPDNLDINI